MTTVSSAPEGLPAPTRQGLGLLAGGGRPREILHFEYSIVALGSLPIAESLSRRMAPRRQAIATVVGVLVALAVIVRLFQTG